MKQLEITPGINLNQEIINPHDNTPQKIKVVVNKTKIETFEVIYVKAIITDINGNPVPNAIVYWDINDYYDEETITTDENGVSTKKIQRYNPGHLKINAECEGFKKSVEIEVVHLLD